MKNTQNIRVKLWGVRGSIPTPKHGYLGYGGNTSCIEVRCGDDVLIIDAGTGIRDLGASLLRESGDAPITANLLFTHFHWDHIQGLPLFAPLYMPGNEFLFHAGVGADSIREILCRQMTEPYFPVRFDLLRAQRTFLDAPADGFKIGRAAIYPFPLNHPQGAYGYRIEMDGAVFVHASDLEPGEPRFDRILREYARNADVLVIDSQYTPAEYASKRGWGHSTWLESVRVAQECSVGQVVLFHHDPSHDDRIMDQVVDEAQTHFENTVGARETCEIVIPCKTGQAVG